MKSSSIAPASRIFARPSRASRRLRMDTATAGRASIKSPRGPEDDSCAAAPVAFEGTLGETRRPMTSRARATLLALATIAIPALGLAQFPLDQQGRHGLRDRYNQPQNHQKLDENIRKLNGDDPEARLEAVRALGEINEPKAIEYLLQAANDPDMRIRIKAIDTLGNAHAKEATGLLIQQLFLRGTDLPTKQRILAALGEIGDRAALSALESLAKDGPDDVLRRLAVEAARKIRDRPAPAVVPPALAVDHRPSENAATR